MKQVNKEMLLLVLAGVLLASCGPADTEVWLRVEEDSSHPCLGAGHLRVRVQGNDLQPGPAFDEFALFFDKQTLQCHIGGELRYPGLPTGSGYTVEMSLSDSSTEDRGVLSEVVSKEFSVSAGSPIQEVTISLYRQPGVLQGTVIAYKPADWGVVSGIKILQFRVIKDGETTPARAYYVAWDSQQRPDPFPLVFSNLPAPVDLELYHLYLEGLDDQQQLLRTWSAPVYLQQGSVFDVQL